MRPTLTAVVLAPALTLALVARAPGEDLPGRPDPGWDVASTRSDG